MKAKEKYPAGALVILPQILMVEEETIKIVPPLSDAHP